MKPKFIYLPLLFIVGIIVFFSMFLNCYTSFTHPTVYIETEDSTGYIQTEEVTLIEDCSACHEQESPYVESYSNTYNDPIYEDNYDWNYYFVTPWWFDESYYYDEPRLKTNQNRLEPTQRRGFDRRDTTPMPRNSAPRVDRPSLAKPGSDNNNISSPAPLPNKRHERRQTVTRDNVKPSEPSTPPPKRESRESSKKEVTIKKEKK